MPMCDRAPGIQDQWKGRRRCLGVRHPAGRDETCPAVVGLEAAVAVETPGRGCVGCAGRIWPLNAAVYFDRIVGHARVVAETSRGDALPFLEGVFRLRPGGKERLTTPEGRSEI